MRATTMRKTALCIAMGLCFGSMSMGALAANNDGSLAGRTTPGAEVTIRSPDTGFTRTVKADEQGNYRFPFLPVGQYTLQTSVDGAASEPTPVTVSLGTTTNVNVGSQAATDLAAVQVVGTRGISPVDVSSTEIATNITREQIDVLPVQRDVVSVALLAPGVVKGKGSLGGQGLSFGGSSIAENTVYINGLNVTDFYNRVGFSSVPFNFYREFQVKTGGYSVEFGRSTGGVINAVTRSGSNDFHAGAELNFEPRAWQSAAKDRVDRSGTRYLTASQDDYSRTTLNAFASGALIKDRLFFFGMYEARDYAPRNTNDAGTVYNMGKATDPFWGGKLDWQINDNHLLSLFGFSDKNRTTTDVFGYDFDTKTRGQRTNQIYNDTGGTNWALSYSGYLSDSFSMKLLYGENERERAQSSLNDITCNRVVENRTASQGVPVNLQGDRGCTSSSLIENAIDNRKAARADFEWQLGDHLFRFGLDHEENTSDYQRYYPGPSGYRYDVYYRNPGAPLNGGVVPASGLVVRTRRLEVDGSFETINSAYYLEDNWSVTPNLLLNLGVRLEAFDNMGGDGKSYIKIDDMLAPRFGFSWDMKGDGTTKLFGNIGRYFLPVANVINIKQAGGFLDERTWYEFLGYGAGPQNTPILGGQIGPVDNSQGDGTVPDLRAEVNRDMEPVYQDEAILGFQQMFGDHWSWGITGTYRKLHDAIDDMNITATGRCGEVDSVWIMGNPGRVNTVWGDTDCDGSNDGWIDIDTSREGWALYDDAGNYVGQTGWVKPRRTYKAIELQLDRAWDGRWAFNASYTYSKSEGNAEGPVNSDTDFADSGRTENFDNPWVNYNGYGYLANDRRHQLKLRGAYAVGDHWLFGATLDVKSGSPITGFGAGNPFDETDFHSYYICVQNCTSTVPSQRVYVLSPRGGYGRTDWTYDLGASVTYQAKLGRADLKVKFAVYNLFNQQRELAVDQDLEPQDSIGTPNERFGLGSSFQEPRHAQLTVSVNF
ncbi:TonB-dependent receptor [Lysobacter sp. CCNWLW3]|uniref:TonB-dependent receptor n=1 Tax=unclassified Lysobacter TaxID=2635362 RepID=UPI002FD11AF2